MGASAEDACEKVGEDDAQSASSRVAGARRAGEGPPGRRVDALGPAFRAGVDLLIERNRPKRGGAKARAKTIRRLAMLTGAVTVARAVGPGPLREEILAACQEA